jgi:hypothetical protein
MKIMPLITVSTPLPKEINIGGIVTGVIAIVSIIVSITWFFSAFDKRISLLEQHLEQLSIQNTESKSQLNEIENKQEKIFLLLSKHKGDD